MSGLLEPRPQDAHELASEVTGVSREPVNELSRMSHQPAPIPVLLTLLFLSEWTSGSDGTVFDTSHELTGDQLEPCETDLVAIAYGARPMTHTHILIGECKGQGLVDAADVRKLSAVSARLRASGVSCDVVFSTTRTSFAEQEMELFREYYESSSEFEPLRRAPLLLTANELDFHRYTTRSKIERDNFSETEFSSLVSWSTSKLVGTEGRD
jgi:hypothetical protein